MSAVRTILRGDRLLRVRDWPILGLVGAIAPIAFFYCVAEGFEVLGTSDVLIRASPYVQPLLVASIMAAAAVPVTLILTYVALRRGLGGWLVLVAAPTALAAAVPLVAGFWSAVQPVYPVGPFERLLPYVAFAMVWALAFGASSRAIRGTIRLLRPGAVARR